MSSKPVTMAPPATNVANDRTTAAFDRGKEVVSPNSADAAQRGQTAPWSTLVTWALIIGIAGSGWYYRAAWLPWATAQISHLTHGAGGTAAPKAAPPRIVPVVTAVVQQKNMDVFLNGLGTVTAFKTVTIRSRVEGELVKVAFTEGQMIKEGDLLAEIDRRPFDVQLQQAEGQLARDEATLKSADITFKRYQELIASKSITAQQVDEQRALVQQTAGAIQSDLAAVENAKLNLAYCHITAPISGRIGLRLVDQGNIVRANDPVGLAVITQLQPIALVFTIPQDDIVRVQKPQLAGKELVVDAYDRDFKIKLASGKLLAIDNQVDATTGTIRLKAVFDNEDGLLFPNQFVNARLLVDTKRDAIVVPSAAVQRGPNNTFVYVVQEDDTVELRTVKPGLVEGAETQIETGLVPGEVVVTEGIDKLQPKTQITTRDKEKAKEAEKEKEKQEKEQGNQKGSDGEPRSKPAESPAGPNHQTAGEPAKKGST